LILLPFIFFSLSGRVSGLAKFWLVRSSDWICQSSDLSKTSGLDQGCLQIQFPNNRKGSPVFWQGSVDLQRVTLTGKETACDCLGNQACAFKRRVTSALLRSELHPLANPFMSATFVADFSSAWFRASNSSSSPADLGRRMRSDGRPSTDAGVKQRSRLRGSSHVLPMHSSASRSGWWTSAVCLFAFVELNLKGGVEKHVRISRIYRE